MIDISGSAHRFFVFPADLPLAYAFYSDVSRLLNYLPHVCLVRAYSGHQFRMLYTSTELGLYHIRIFWDVEAVLDDEKMIRVRPLPGISPVKPEAGLYSATAQGYFSSESAFESGEAGAGSARIDYRLKLQARLPSPLAARFMPSSVLDRIAHGIMQLRMREIADGFVDRSVAAFPHWLDELREPACRPGRSRLDADASRRTPSAAG